MQSGCIECNLGSRGVAGGFRDVAPLDAAACVGPTGVVPVAAADMVTGAGVAQAVLQAIEAARIVPVVTLEDPDDAGPLADALVAGGVRAIELTLRTSSGLAAIQRLAGRDDLLVGAGTVMSERQVEQVVGAGARFVVSPGLDPRVVRRATDDGAVPIPGVATASEVQQALALGLDAVKLFPAHLLGGVRMIDALSAPFPGLRFLPSGGVDASNAAEYLSRRAVLAVGGSWIAPPAAIAAGDWRAITRLAAEAVEPLTSGAGW